MKAKSGKTLFVFFVILTIIITLMPFFRIGFTTGDDLEYYLTRLIGDISNNARVYAYGAGRFYFLITKPLYSFPYIVDNFMITKLIQYASLLLSFVLFALVVKKIFKSGELGMLSLLLLIIPLSVTPVYYIPIIAYPFFFTFSFSLALSSLLLLLKYFEVRKSKFLIWSAVLYAVTILFYETYLIFLFFICLFIFIRNCINSGLLNTFKSKSFYTEFIPFVSIGIIYIISYFVFRAVVATPEGFYNGSSFVSNFSLGNFFTILFKYNNSVLPIKVYHLNQHIISANSLLPEGHINNFWYILTHSSVLWIVNGLIQSVLVFILLYKNKSYLKGKVIFAGLFCSFLFAIFSHFLIAISEKYNSQYPDLDAYVTSYYSYFGITLFISLLLFGLYLLFCNHKWLQYSVLGLISGAVFYVSLITSYSNDHLSRDWQRSQNRFNVINEMAKEKAFDNIPEKSLIYAPDLYETSSLCGKNICNQNFKWEVYIDFKSGKKFRIFRYPEEMIKAISDYPEAPVYRITKRENIKNNDVLIAVAKTGEDNLNFQNPEILFSQAVCDEAELYFYSPKKDFVLSCNLSNPDSSAKDHNSYFLYINSVKKNRKLVHATVRQKGMIVESFNLAGNLPLYQTDTLIVK